MSGLGSVRSGLPSKASALSLFLVVAIAVFAPGCAPESGDEAEVAVTDEASDRGEALLAKYTSFRLETDQELTEAERRMIPLLIEAADAMDAVFWQQAYGDRDELLGSIEDPELRRFAEINYGPWDRLDGNRPFVEGVGPKPPGANLYPADLDKQELQEALEGASPEDAARLRSLYTLVRRSDEGDGGGDLVAVPYSEAFAEQMALAADRLRAAAELAESPALREYLELRAAALVAPGPEAEDAYYASDLAWMSMKDNRLDVVIGPIETYEDQLAGAKAAAEAYILIKDMAWSERLQRYAELLPDLQRGLPVAAEYKAEMPGTEAELNAYEVLYYAGDCNAGSKTIAINLPNDERVQLEKGTRRLQLKNAMRAKFDEILVPIAGVLIHPDQRARVTFDAFFANTMFHEVAHGLGIKNTVDGRGTVREALQEHSSALEEGKADVLGLYMVTQLAERGELDEGADLSENLVTFVASIFRSIRFGTASAHGKANLIRFNFFRELGAIERDAETDTWRIVEEKIAEAADALSERILTFQGDGDYAGVAAFVERYAVVDDELQADLDRLAEAGIPVDIVFEQGLGALGLEGSTSTGP